MKSKDYIIYAKFYNKSTGSEQKGNINPDSL